MAEPVDSDNKAFLGKGVAFPLRLSVQGRFQLTAGIQNIEESIRVILQTGLGERVYRPDFGSRLSELVFAPMNTQTLLLIRLCVEEALTMWEPRIVLDTVRTEPDPLEGRINIIIEYHPKSSHDRLSMVYPFYLLPLTESV